MDNERRLIEDLIRRLFTRNIDLNGRRIINAGKSQDNSDYVIRQELEDIKARLEKLERS